MNKWCISSTIQVLFTWIKGKECSQAAIHQASYQKQKNGLGWDDISLECGQKLVKYHLQ